MSAVGADPWMPASGIGPVLIADDSALLRAVLRSELTGHGWQVEEASDGVQALERCRALHPHILLLDIEMPRMNGYQVLAALRGDPALAEIPVIFLTARDSGADVADGLRRGAHDYLRKPFDANELLARLLVADRTRRLRDELRKRSRELEHLAMSDPLTGLHNRRWMHEQLTSHIALAHRHDHVFSVLMIDLDHFKAVNDHLGHEAGDAVMREIAARLKARTRHGDALARWGGDEFLILLPDTDATNALRLAQELVTVATDPIPLPGHPAAQQTVSIGVAQADTASLTRLIERADHAMYQAKQAGRNTVRVASVAHTPPPAPAGTLRGQPAHSSCRSVHRAEPKKGAQR